MELDADDKFQLLDTIGIPKNNLLFSSLNDILIYSIGANVILYNLKNNTKTFLQYYYKSEISTFKFLDNKEQLLLIINKSSHPLLSIWRLPYLEEIYSEELFFDHEIQFTDIYVEKLYSNLFIIIIAAIDSNIMYALKHENFSNFNIEKICRIQRLSNGIDGFKCFFDDIYLIIIINNNLLYYLIDSKKIFFSPKNNYNNNQEIIKLYQRFTFPFKLIKNSLKISNKYGLIFFITSKGNCLIYNKKGENKTSINPVNKDENFTSIYLNDNSLCLGTNSTKIYIYNLDNNFKLKYFIKEQTLLDIKLNFQLNNNDNNETNKNKQKIIDVEYINLNQKLDKIFIKLSNNTIIYVPLTSLMSDSRGVFNFNSLGNKSCLYTFNHSGPINSIEINNNYNEYETIIYSCSKDGTLIQYNIDFSTNKFSNLYFNLKEILKTQNDIDNINIKEIYLTIIKFHPNDNTKLLAGDNMGYLYIFDINENYFQYKKYCIDNNSIESISFSKEGNLICVGLLTGKQVIYDINKNCDFCLKLNGNYLLQNEIDFRISNYHVITYNYFFRNQKHKDCILFMKNTKKVEYSKLFYEKGKLNKKKIILNEFENEILDIQIHLSENYLVALNDKNKILINEINLGETTAVIDLNEQFDKIYNFVIDRSGLYICIICANPSSDYDNDLIFLEIGTGEMISYIKCTGQVYKIIFDYYSRYIITGSHDGILSLWKIPHKISNIMINVLSEIEKNENYWEQYEIKYYNNQSKRIFKEEDENEIEMPRKFRTEITKNNNKSQEIEDNGPHKGIQTWQTDNHNNGMYDMKKNNRKNERKNIDMENYSFENKQIEENNINNKKDNIINYMNNVNYNSYIPNNNKITYNNDNKNNKSKKISIQKENYLDNNLKEENSLQKCYENFKKERLMKNSFIKPNKNEINKNINKDIFYKKGNNKSLSSQKILPSNKKYFKQQISNNDITLFNKDKYNKKENDNIDFEIDFDINKIRPNLDPNLCSENGNQKYSNITNELIRPYLKNKKYDNKNDFLRQTENDYNKLSNNEYPNFNTSNTNNISISQKQLYKSNTSRISENNKINDAMNILMDKTRTKNNENNLNSNIKNNKSISSKDISHDFAYINNVKVEPSRLKEFSEEFSQKYNSNVLNNEKKTLSKNIESLSTRKRNGINENINNFEKRLNYYGN